MSSGNLFVCHFVKLLPILNDPGITLRTGLEPPIHLPIKQGVMLNIIFGGNATGACIGTSEAHSIIHVGFVSVLLLIGLPFKYPNQGAANSMYCNAIVA